jgi:hypothetical protein
MITQEYLKSILDYNPVTGEFLWKVNSASNKVKTGSLAGCINKITLYRQIGINKKFYLAHRLAWLYLYGTLPDKFIDHINHDRSDNRIQNLRIVARDANQRNCSLSKRNNSGIIGVSWNKKHGNWQSFISINGKNKNLGSFESIEQAAISRKNAEQKYNYHENHGSSLTNLRR